MLPSQMSVGHSLQCVHSALKKGYQCPTHSLFNSLLRRIPAHWSVWLFRPWRMRNSDLWLDGDRIKTDTWEETGVSHQQVDLTTADPMEHKKKQTKTNHRWNKTKTNHWWNTTIGEVAVGWKALRTSLNCIQPWKSVTRALNQQGKMRPCSVSLVHSTRQKTRQNQKLNVRLEENTCNIQ